MGHYFAIMEKDLIRLTILNKERPFTLDELFMEFPNAKESLIKDILNDCVNSDAVSYDITTDAYVNNHYNSDNHIDEIKPTIFTE